MSLSVQIKMFRVSASLLWKCKRKLCAASESNMQEELEKASGEKCASFMCSMNLFSSTLDSQMRQSELSFLAEHVLDYM